MTPQEKAKELVDKFYDIEYADFYQNNGYSMNWSEIQQCALIAVDEIIEVLSKDINPLVNYWFQVKEEIEKL